MPAGREVKYERIDLANLEDSSSSDDEYPHRMSQNARNIPREETSLLGRLSPGSRVQAGCMGCIILALLAVVFVIAIKSTDPNLRYHLDNQNISTIEDFYSTYSTEGVVAENKTLPSANMAANDTLEEMNNTIDGLATEKLGTSTVTEKSSITISNSSDRANGSAVVTDAVPRISDTWNTELSLINETSVGVNYTNLAREAILNYNSPSLNSTNTLILGNVSSTTLSYNFNDSFTEKSLNETVFIGYATNSSDTDVNSDENADDTDYHNGKF